MPDVNQIGGRYSKGILSPPFSVNPGVSQGSILAPTLFPLLISDLPTTTFQSSSLFSQRCHSPPFSYSNARQAATSIDHDRPVISTSLASDLG